jgi:hypothetical protein
MRICLIVGATVVSSVGGYYLAQPCDKITFTLKSRDITMALYPECASFLSGENLDQHAIVKATYFKGNAMEVAAAFDMCFGAAVWLALALHVFGAELYVSLQSV